MRAHCAAARARFDVAFAPRGRVEPSCSASCMPKDTSSFERASPSNPVSCSLAEMKLYLTFLILGGFAYFSSAQCTASPSCSNCRSNLNTWCSNSASGLNSGCCVTSSSCPSSYSYTYYSSCSFYDYYNGYTYYVRVCDTGCIIGYVISSIIWVANMIAVVKYCKDRNIPPTGYVVIAFLFGVFVWCCLASAGRQQLVIVQAGNVPYQAQPGAYPAQPYGQPSYGQPYAAGQPSNPYAQPQPYAQQGAYNPPAAPYGGAPHNPYTQPVNPYVSSGDISKPQ